MKNLNDLKSELNDFMTKDEASSILENLVKETLKSLVNETYKNIIKQIEEDTKNARFTYKNGKKTLRSTTRCCDVMELSAQALGDRITNACNFYINHEKLFKNDEFCKTYKFQLKKGGGYYDKGDFNLRFPLAKIKIKWRGIFFYYLQLSQCGKIFYNEFLELVKKNKSDFCLIAECSIEHLWGDKDFSKKFEKDKDKVVFYKSLFLKENCKYGASPYIEYKITV